MKRKYHMSRDERRSVIIEIAVPVGMTLFFITMMWLCRWLGVI